MATSFTYTPLPNDCIRLLTFAAPSTYPGVLTCTINTFPLDNPPSFDALSYTWGAPSKMETILCNGLEMKIGANLHEAIQTLFSPPISLDLPIWIDAICINQGDDEEKGHQVHRMGDVYRRANKVVIWLGPAENDSDLAMESLPGLSERLSSLPFGSVVYHFEENGLPDENSPVWYAVGNLFRRQWFGRLWTFQETVLAAKLIAVAGQKMADWTLISTVAGQLWELGLWSTCVGYQRLEKLGNGFKAVADISWARSHLKDLKELDPTYLLEMVSHKTCLEPRDRVYAILGMTSLSFRNRIEISYSDGTNQHIWRTFIDCAKACIEEGHFPILALVAGRERISDLPSWCPNFRSNPADLGRYSGREVLFAGNTTGLSSSKISSIKTSRESDTLLATGFRVDVVSEIVDGYYDGVTVPKGAQLRQRARRVIEWESRRLALAQKTLSLSAKTIPLAHIFTLTASTRGWWLEQHNARDGDLFKTYLNLLDNLTKVALGGYADVETLTEVHNDMWSRIHGINPGRRYFSTENGRLGLGPPEIQKGDTVCVFYGTETVMLLRPAKSNPGEWYFVGDAFVHGLMKLDETPECAKGADEIFTIA
jgi:hypothetical protein